MVIAATVVTLVASAIATAAPGPIGQYVALGDSYAATGTLAKFDGRSPGCGRSTDNYPGNLARNLQVGQFIDVSCGLATTDGMTGPELTPTGMTPPQLDALGSATELVTLTIGGNDFGFGDMGARCAALGAGTAVGAPCRDSFLRNGDEIGARLAYTGPRVGAVLDEIHRRAPRAAVFVTGYLPTAPETGGCRPYLLLADGDVVFLHQVGQRLNDLLRDIATTHGATYVDVAGQPGHDACQAPGIRWTEPAVSAPSSWLPLHPTAEGQTYVADAVAAAVRG